MYNPAGVIESGEALKNPHVLTRIAIRYKVLDPSGPGKSFIPEDR